MRIFIALALLTLVSCSEKYIVENEISMQEVDDLIHQNQHNLDSACKLTTMADSMAKQQISSMSIKMRQMNAIVRVQEKVKIVYVFDTIYVPVYDVSEGLSLEKTTKVDNR